MQHRTRADLGRRHRRRHRRSRSRAVPAPGRVRRPRLRAGHRAQRGRRRHPDQPERVARPARARPRRRAGAHGRAAAGVAPAPLGRRADAAARAAGRARGRGAFGFPHYQIHRADLLAALVAALPAERLHVGHRFAGVVDHGDRVEVQVRQRRRRRRVDVLVGADGIHSDVRSALFGPEEPRFTGCVAYRGLVPASACAHLELEVTAQIWMGPGAHFVHYFVQQRRLVNFVAVFDQDTWTRESWTDRGEVAERWRRSRAGTRRCTRSSARSTRRSSGRCSTARRCRAGRRAGCTLLGDACHPMLPFMAQGAAQAIEDGATLAACLADGPDVPRGAASATSGCGCRARRGSRRCRATNKTRFHLPDGPEQQERDARMAGGSTDFALQGGRVDLQPRRRPRAPARA